MGPVAIFAVCDLPAATRALARWTSEGTRGFGLGITHAAGRIGAGVTAPIVAVLLTVMSWRMIFVLLGPYQL